MAISKKWSSYSKLVIKKISPELIGVYEIAHRENNIILYIGEGKIRDRLLAHFPDGKRPEEIVVGANVFRFEITNNKKQAVNLQNEHIADFKLKNKGNTPKYNQRSFN